jgi:hypothetical protein
MTAKDGPKDGPRSGGTGTKADLAPAERRVYGPRAIGALLPAIARPAFRKRGPQTAQVLADWQDIVGPALGAVTEPRKLAAGTLTIACAGPVALELQHLAPELLARINTQLGGAPVQRLRFVQAAVAARAAHRPARKPASKAAERAAREAVAGLPDGPLRDALAALGRAVLSRAATPG